MRAGEQYATGRDLSAAAEAHEAHAQRLVVPTVARSAPIEGGKRWFVVREASTDG